MVNTLSLLEGIAEGASTKSSILESKGLDHRRTLKPFHMKLQKASEALTKEGFLSTNSLTLLSFLSSLKADSEEETVEFEVVPALVQFIKGLSSAKQIEAVSAIAGLIMGVENKAAQAKDFGYYMGVAFLKFLEKNLQPVEPLQPSQEGSKLRI